jgi:chromosome segregation ATPase
VRISEQQRRQIEDRIRAAADRLLGGKLPPGGRCDVQTLAQDAGVSRAALYSTYRHLKDEFDRRREQLRNAGQISDPREAQIDRLQAQIAQLTKRVADRDQEISELKAFRIEAVSRLAAQHDEILRLRQQTAQAGQVRRLPTAR